MKLRHLLITPSDTVAYTGYMTFEFGICDRDDPSAVEMSLNEIVNLLHQARTNYQIKSMLVTIDNTVPGQYDSNEVLELAQVLVSKKHTLIGKIPGHDFGRFIPTCAYTVAVVSNEPWMNYACQEVQYIPPLKGAFVEPLIEAQNTPAHKSLHCPPETSPQVILAFQHKASYPWSVHLTHQPPYTVKIV